MDMDMDIVDITLDGLVGQKFMLPLLLLLLPPLLLLLLVWPDLKMVPYLFMSLRVGFP
jgi:hypothetical protein